MTSMVNNCNNSIKSVVRRLVFGALVYFIWQERNKRQFTMERRDPQSLAGTILDTVKMRMSGLRVINSSNVQSVAKDWNVDFKRIHLIGNTVRRFQA